MPDIYKKIEKRIVELKEKEELWKGRYKEMAQHVKELSDSTAENVKQMENSIRAFDSRIEQAEKQAKASNERAAELLKLMDRRISEMSKSAKGMSGRMEEDDEKIRKLKAEVTETVAGMISKHEKTFDSILGRMSLAAKGIESEVQRGEGLYGRMEETKRFIENYTPEYPQQDIPRKPNGFSSFRAEEPPFAPPRPVMQPIPEAPRPERPAPQIFQSPAAYSQAPMMDPPQDFMRMHSRKQMMEDDDDMDVDDMVSGNMKDFKGSVDAMNSNITAVTQKLAAIEDKVASMQVAKNPNIDRLDDKIRMYTESVAGIHSRMDTVEKALRDGMTPMMESLKLLTESVKTLKEDSRSRPAVQKPEPPSSKPVLIPTPSNRAPSSFQRSQKRLRPGPDLGVSYG